MKIKFRIEVWEKTVLFQILEMDARFRYRGGPKDEKKYKVKISPRHIQYVESLSCPEITDCRLYLIGENKEKDHSIIQKQCNSVKSAFELKTDIIYALQEWAKNWEGFKKDKKEALKTDETVFEF